MKNILISILNFNSRKETFNCLNSIKKIKTENFKISVLLINNGSKEKLTIKEDFINPIPLKLIENISNLGFAGGHNISFKYAIKNNFDYILILNNDVELNINFLKEMVSAIKSDSDIGIVVPKIYFSPGFEYHKDRYVRDEIGRVFWYAGGKFDWNNIVGLHRGVDEVDIGQYNKREETDYATGCCMLLKTEALKKSGLFDEKYFLYYEDGDLSLRIKRCGYKIIYEPNAIVYHNNASSSGGSGSNLQDYYITRNRMMFGLKYAPLRAKFALIKESAKILTKGRNWQKKAIIDFYIKKFGKGSFNP